MPVLKNARQEKFAQAIAHGQPQIKAAKTAGYKPQRSNASRLIANEKVRLRVNELMGASADRVVNSVTYTRDTLLGYLEDARTMAVEKKNAVALTGATVAMARILGLIIDRREVGDAGAFDNLTDEELLREIEKKTAELGVGPRLVVDNEGEA